MRLSRMLAVAAMATSLPLIAIAADTDNTHARAHAGFADLHFVARVQKCETR